MLFQPSIGNCACKFFLEENALVAEKSEVCAFHEGMDISDIYASYEMAREERRGLLVAARNLANDDVSMIRHWIDTPNGTIELDNLTVNERTIIDLVYPASNIARHEDIREEYQAAIILNEDKTFSTSLPVSDKSDVIISSK